jgi:hypothetical protein
VQRVAIAVLAAAGAAGCGGGGGGGGGDDAPSTSCASTLRVWGQQYRGAAMHAERGAKLAVHGVLPGCGGTDRTVGVVRLRGVPPAVAVARSGGPRDQVFVADGYFPVLRGHPLHAALVRQAHGLPQPRHCGAAWRARGPLARTPVGDRIEVRSGGKTVVAAVTQGTRIFGFRRAGEAYLQRGDLVVASGRRCSLGEGPELVVERIAPFT